MTPQEAYKHHRMNYQGFIDTMWDGNEDNNQFDTAFKMSLEAIRKQIPEKPIPCEEVGTGVVCHCGQTLLKNWKPDFCMFCGQAIDWSDEA